MYRCPNDNTILIKEEFKDTYNCPKYGINFALSSYGELADSEMIEGKTYV